MHRARGFTLIELLLVIGIISILASVVIAALSPTRQLASSRNAKRQNDVNGLINAVYQYTIDNVSAPVGIPTGTPKEICKTTAASCNNGVNLNVLTGSGRYLVALPIDPQEPATSTGTSYTIMQTSNGRITITSLGAEQGASISITR